MREATIANYTNPNPLLNSTFATAVAIVNHLATRSRWQRWKTGYTRPKVVGAECLPQDMTLALSEAGEKLGPEAFGPQGWLNSALLNHGIVLLYEGLPPIRIPAGYLAQFFVIGVTEGLTETARIVEEFQSVLAGKPIGIAADQDDLGDPQEL